jgi:hypothetical protein
MKINDDFYVVDLYAPDLIIPLYRLQTPGELYKVFLRYNIRGYNYAFYYNKDLLKIGFSYPLSQNRTHTNTFGERVVRQVAHAPGWTQPFISANGQVSGTHIQNYGYVADSENGEEFYHLLMDYRNKSNITLDQHNIYVHLWNLTNVKSKKFFFGNDDVGNKRKGRYFEAILVEQYKLSNNNMLPLGNIDHDPTMLNNEFTQAQISAEAAELFDWDS